MFLLRNIDVAGRIITSLSTKHKKKRVLQHIFACNSTNNNAN